MLQTELAAVWSSQLVTRCCLLTFAGLMLLSGGCTFCPDSRTHCSPSCDDNPSGSSTRVLCRCDEHCALYDDCCVDYLSSCVNNRSQPETGQASRAAELSEFFACVPTINAEPLRNNFVAVSRCPPEWPTDGVRENCEADSVDDEFLKVLVTSIPDGIVFKNIYCTICHGVELSRLQPWSVEFFYCTINENEIPSVGRLNLSDVCLGVDTMPPLSLAHAPHHCYPNYIDSCPSPDPSINIQEQHNRSMLCSNHTSIIFIPMTGTVYKNIYCMLCNMHSEGMPDCDLRLPPRTNSGFNKFRLHFDLVRRAVYSPDIVRSGRFNTSQDVVGSCNQQGQMYDPFRNICRDLNYQNGMHLHGDTSTDLFLGGNDSSIIRTDNCATELMSLMIKMAAVDDRNLMNRNDTAPFLFGRHPAIDSRNESGVAFIRAEFALASLLADIFARYLFNVMRDTSSWLTCNVSSVVLIASSPDNQECQTYAFSAKVSLADVFLSDDSHQVNVSGFLYGEDEVILETEFAFDEQANETSVKSSVTLCCPFVDEACPSARVVLSRDDFRLSGSNGTLLVHKASNRSFPVIDVWLLPDGTLRLCNYTHQLPTHSLSSLILAYLPKVSLIGEATSAVCLILTLSIFIICPSFRHQTGVTVIHLLVALLMVHVISIVGTVVPVLGSGWLCVIKESMLLNFWLSTLSWLIVLTCVVTLGFSPNPDRQVSRCRKCVSQILIPLCAWGGPAVLISMCFLVNKLNRDQEEAVKCRIGDMTHTLLTIGLPSGLLLLIGIAVLIIGSVIAARDGSNWRAHTVVRLTGTAIGDTLLCLKFVLVIGTNLALVLICKVSGSAIIVFCKTFDVVSSLQGALIALVIVLSFDSETGRRCLDELGGARCCSRLRRAQQPRDYDVNDITNGQPTTSDQPPENMMDSALHSEAT